MEPAHYLAASYYERWLYSAEQRLLRKGTIRPGEVEGAMERLAAGASVPEHRDISTPHDPRARPPSSAPRLRRRAARPGARGAARRAGSRVDRRDRCRGR